MSKKISRRDFLKLGGLAAFGASGFVRLPSLLDGVRAQDLPFVELKYLIRGAQQEDIGIVNDRLNELLEERINAHVTLEIIDRGAYNDTMALINSAGEQYDCCFTAPWANNYYLNVNQGYIEGLDDLLPEYAPGLWASMPETTWEAARVAGEIFGVINQQIFVKPFGMSFREDIIEQIDGFQEMLDAVVTYEDVDPILAAIYEIVQADDTLEVVFANYGALGGAETWGYDPIGAGMVVHKDDEELNVLIGNEQEYAIKAAKLARKWREAGYIWPDWLDDEAQWQATSAGQVAMTLSHVIKPGVDLEQEARFGYKWTSRAVAEPLLTTAGTTATLTGISTTSADAERTMMFLELLNTDEEIYNLICKGVEGVHWQWKDEENKVIEPVGAESFSEVGWYPNSDWMFGNQFNAYYIDEAQVGAWEGMYELNQNAQVSPALGFTFDREPVEQQLAALSAIGQEFGEPISRALIEDVDEGLERLWQAQEDAGIKDVQEEMQRQVDAWAAANK